MTDHIPQWSVEKRARVEQIRALQKRHRRRYGSPRVWQELKSQGIVVGHNRVARLMRLNDLQCALVIDAFMMAVVRRRPTGGLLFHSDRGIQYCVSAFRSVSEMAVPQLLRSMSRKGNCGDNACAESFFKTLKRELEELDGSYRRKKVRLAVFEYREGYYNRLRIHTSIGFLPPVMVSSRVA